MKDNWDKINAVQRMQECIERNITEMITLRMLARAAGYSPWHAARIFKELTGKAPFEYIRELRLSRAAIRLREKNTRVLDVALDFVFDSHEGFTRAFSKQFGVSPRDYSRNGPPVKLFMPYRVREYYLRLQKGEEIMSDKANVSTVFVQVVDRPERKLILKRGVKATNYYEYGADIGFFRHDLLSFL